jgi:hypothetical protein
MKKIILITRENNEKVTHASVYLCNSYDEAKMFCRFVNSLSLESGEKLAAREVQMNKEYSLKKYVPYSFDDILQLNNMTIQKVMRDLDNTVLAIALKDEREEVKEHFFKNISKRASAMLKEDIEYIGQVCKSDIEDAKQLILDIFYNSTIATFDRLGITYKDMKKSKKKEEHNAEEERNHIVLVFCGCGNFAESVSISLFDTCRDADNYRDFINNLKTDKDTFIFARNTEQMVEYEITKPLLIRFEQIFEYGEIYNDFITHEIISLTLKKIDDETLLKALRGLDKRYREHILQCITTETADRINETIETYDKSNRLFPFTLDETRKARQKIVNAVNRNVKKYDEDKLGIAKLKG